MPAPLHMALPPGRYGVAVSGGADSVALLHLLHHQHPDLHLRVIHLDHQLRGADSTADAEFVRDLAGRWNLPHAIARRAEVEPDLPDPPANPQARYRALRHLLFRRAAAENQLDAILLAHHADDQAETILQRLLRRAGPAGLAGMSPRSVHAGLVILRPLLQVRRQELRDYLIARNQPWREDVSNASPDYLRNRLRLLLSVHGELTASVLELSRACAELEDWTRRCAPMLKESFPAATLAGLPEILARHAARRWLLARGIPRDELSPGMVQRLITLAGDAASPPRQQFSANVTIRRRGGMIFVD